MVIEDFSAGYWFVPDIEVSVYSGERAVLQDDVFNLLVVETGLDPLIGSAGGAHFELLPERSIPSDVVAVPRSVVPDSLDGGALLISKMNGRGVYGVG